MKVKKSKHCYVFWGTYWKFNIEFRKFIKITFFQKCGN